MPTNAKYKVYNGSSWVEYHFTTNAAQVSQTTGTGWRTFVSSIVKVNGQSFEQTVSNNSITSVGVTIDGTHITGQAIVDTTNNNSALHYIAATDSVAVALGKLDKAAKDAFNNIPSGILTTANYSTTLNSAYQALDQDLTDIVNLTGAGLLRRNSSGTTWTLDNTSYVPTSRTINNKQLNANVTLYGADIKLASNRATTVTDAIDSLGNKVAGMSTSYAISSTYTGSDTSIKNTDFAITDNEITLSHNASSPTSAKLLLSDGTTTINISDLKVGDSVFVTNLGYPDRWVTYWSTTQVKLSKLETYNLAWNAIANKPTLSISGQTVTIGSNAVTVPTLAPATSGSSNPNNGTATTAARSDHTHSGYIPTSGTSALTGNIVPSTADESLSLGSSNNRFGSVYSNKLQGIGVQIVGSTTVSLLPSTYLYIQTGNPKSAGQAYLSTELLTTANTNRKFCFPNKDGTFAMTNDLTYFRKIVVASESNPPSSPTSGDIWIATPAA